MGSSDKVDYFLIDVLMLIVVGFLGVIFISTLPCRIKTKENCKRDKAIKESKEASSTILMFNDAVRRCR